GFPKVTSEYYEAIQKTRCSPSPHSGHRRAVSTCQSSPARVRAGIPLNHNRLRLGRDVTNMKRRIPKGERRRRSCAAYNRPTPDVLLHIRNENQGPIVRSLQRG